MAQCLGGKFEARDATESYEVYSLSPACCQLVSSLLPACFLALLRPVVVGAAKALQDAQCTRGGVQGAGGNR